MNTLRSMVAGLAFACMTIGSAFALDAPDVMLMVQNGVEDSVIMNLVRSQPLSRPLTPQEVVTFTNAGASPALLEFLTRPESAAAPYAVPAPAVVVAPQPSVVVTAPPTVYYHVRRPYPYRHYYRPGSFGFSWGGPRWRGHRRPGPFFGPRPGRRPPPPGFPARRFRRR